MITVAHEEVAVTVTPRNRANFRRLKTNSIQSYKRWEKENELLYAMMEDESEWLAKLFPDVVITPEFFFYALEDGSLLCRLASYIQEKAELYSREQNVPVPGKKFRYHTMSKCGKEIKLFRSRENVQQFLTWCRSHGIPEAILFESNDVVQVDDYREGCRGVIICLMEIVRRTSKFELDELPQLIRMEKEIEEDEARNDTDLSNGQGQILDVERINMNEFDNLEVQQTDQPEIQSPGSLDSDSGVDSVFDQEEGENSASRLTEFTVEESEETRKTTAVTRKQTPSKPKDRTSSPKSQKKTKELPSLLDSTGPKSELDKQVCKLAQDYNIKVVHRLKEGKYIILGRVMFVRMLNDHMLVRIGGGWDTLEHYLMTHAPSKQALDNSSGTPSSQALASPRNSISAGTGSRNSLFDKFKRKEQIGIISRDSPVHSSQGSLTQPLVSQSTPNLREKTKKLSLVESDEKDITDAIRKIESSVSQNLATRPVSFTSKTFHQLKSRFDKGIFGSSRRTSSPDLSVKGKRILRRLSDTSTMADIASSLAFDGVNEDKQQGANANNNDADLKQSESGNEAVLGKVTAPSEDLVGDGTLQIDVLQPEQVVSDEIDASAPKGDFPSTDHAKDANWTEDLLGGPVNGSTNYQAAPQVEKPVDISSFDPFAAESDQGGLISIDSAPSENIKEQPKAAEDIDNGAAVGNGHPESVPGIVSEGTEMRDEFEQISTEAEENSLEFSPRIDLGDLLADSHSAEQVRHEPQEPTVEPTPPVDLGDQLAVTQSAEIKEVKPDELVVREDAQEVPPIVVEPAVESPKLEEATQVEEHVPDEESVVTSEGESTAPVSDETTTQEQSQEVVESVPIKEDESREETITTEEETTPAEVEAKSTEEAVKFVEEEAKTVEEEAKPAEEEAETVEEETKIVEEETKTVEEETKTVEEETKTLEEETKTVEEETKTVEEEAKSTEEAVKFVEEEAKTVEEEAKPAEEAVKFVEEEAKTVEEEAKPTEEEAKPAEEEVKPTEEEVKSVEEEATPAEVEAKSTVEEVKSVQEEATPTEVEAKPAEKEAKSTGEEVKSAEEEAKPAEVQVSKTEKKTEKVTKTKPQSAGAKAKAPTKAAPATAPSAAKKQTGATRPTSPTKRPSSAASKKDVKAPGTKAPPPKPTAGAKVPATKTTTTAPGTKKPTAKGAVTKTEEVKKPERPKSAAAARLPTKTPGTSASGTTRPSSAAPKKVPASTTKPSATKTPGKDATDSGAPKSTPKTTAYRPGSTKPTQGKTSSAATKPAADKPNRPQSTKPRDRTDGATKTPTSRPQSAKPKPTTTTTTVKKTTTTTTTKSGAAPVKPTTTKTATEVKSVQVKSSTTTTKKETTRPTSAAKTAVSTRTTATSAKSKPGAKTSAGSASGKPSTKAAPKKKVEDAKKEKELKQDEKPVSQQEKVVEPAAAAEEKSPEVVETVSEERPVEANPEDKSIELTPEPTPSEQAPEQVDVSSEGVEQSNIVTRIVTSETTTVIADGEEHSPTITTTAEETTLEQTVGES